MVQVADGRDHQEWVLEFIEQYCWQGLEGQLLPIVPNGKVPVLGVRYDRSRPCATADFGRTEITGEYLREYCLKHPLCNLGLRTGQQSDIVAVDFDRPVGDETKAERFAEVLEHARHGNALPGVGPSDTACYETARGVHLLFRRPCAMKSINGMELAELGLCVDIKGEGGMVVIPPSEIDGWTRKFLRGFHCLKTLPRDSEVVRRTLMDETLGRAPVGHRAMRRLPKFYVDGYLCAKALTEREIPRGQRDTTLLVHYSVLRRAGNTPEHSQKVVRALNASLGSPMSEADLKKCFGEYKYGCTSIRQMLPDLQTVCTDCRQNQRTGRELATMVNPVDIEMISRAKVPKIGLAAYLLDRMGQSLTRRQMARCLGVSERAMYQGLRRLRVETGIEVSAKRHETRLQDDVEAAA